MPDHEDSIYESVNRCRMDIAELRGQQMQRTLLTATGAAVLSLVSALGLLLMEFLKHG